MTSCSKNFHSIPTLTVCDFVPWIVECVKLIQCQVSKDNHHRSIYWCMRRRGIMAYYREIICSIYTIIKNIMQNSARSMNPCARRSIGIDRAPTNKLLTGTHKLLTVTVTGTVLTHSPTHPPSHPPTHPPDTDIGVNRPAFGGTVPHFHQMSRSPAKSADVPHFSKMVLLFFRCRLFYMFASQRNKVTNFE